MCLVAADRVRICSFASIEKLSGIRGRYYRRAFEHLDIGHYELVSNFISGYFFRALSTRL